jgi:hypothetical protein
MTDLFYICDLQPATCNPEPATCKIALPSTVYFGDFFPYTDESAVVSSTEKWFSMKLKM